MNKDWHDKLVGFGASADTEGVISFANESGVSRTQVVGQTQDDVPLLVDLSPLAVVDITGPDAKTFLQAQVCNDLASLSENEVQINGYCTPKGRLLAVFTVFSHEDGYRVLLPDGVAQAFVKRLQMFVMRAQVKISICTELICSGLIFDSVSGAEAVQFPADTPSLPAIELQVSNNQQMQIMRWHDMPSATSCETENQLRRPRYICIAEQNAMSRLWEIDSFRHKSYPHWRWADINAGIPNVYTTSTEKFIPQMLNMHLINAMSFKKGCYPGQEIVARMQYLGKLKKHMKLIRVPGASDAPAPGEVLTTDSNSNAGQVVDAVVDEAGLNLLAVVNIDTQINELRLGNLSFVEAQLPYSLVVDDSQAS